jgi:superfamily II DNA or RNA helicase
MIPTGFDLLVDNGEDENPTSWADLPSEQKDFHELLRFMADDEERNDLIWAFIEPCLKEGKTILVATHRVGNAKYWDERIRAAGYTCGLMLGSKKYAAEFRATAESLRSRKLNAGVGTIQKVAQGHDIPALDRGFMLTPLAGNRQLFEQFTGRLRRTADGKTEAVLYYFWDERLYGGAKRRIAKLYPGQVQVWVDGEFLEV